MPLHLCRNASVRRSLSACCAAPILALALTLCVLAPGIAGAQDKDSKVVTPATLDGAAAQTAPASPAAAASTAPVVSFRERPNYVTDPQRLRRTPQIDGVLSDGEWDPFYTITNGPIKGTVYCNWDDNYLYIAARTEQPALMVVDVDSTDDGWLRGADNLELVVGSVTDNSAPTLTARLLDAANSKDTPFWSDKALDLKSILVAEKLVNGTQVIELGIPKNMGSLVLRPGANIGLRVEFLPPGPASSYTPTAPYEPHLLLDATLVDSHVQAAVGVNPHLTLSDYKCVAGQKLFATLDLRNQTDVPVPVRVVLWAGQGNSANAVDTLRQVAVQPIPATGKLKLGYKTILPAAIVPGSYTLTVTADLADGKQVQSSASFSVVEPIQPQLSSDPDPVTVVGSTNLDVALSIYSAVPDHFRGDLTLTNYPAGWTLEGKTLRSVAVMGKDQTGVSHIRFKLPASTAPGDYPIEAQITWHGRTWPLHHIVHVQANAGATAKQEARRENRL